LTWHSGDEVLLPEGEFPASVFPWKVLEAHGVSVRFMPCERLGAPDAAEIASNLSDRTRLFCASWVNSFSGWAIDVDAVGEVCRKRGVWFVLNASQGMGARRIDVSHTRVDAITTCGWKWLLGPYGTGAMWVAPRLGETLEPTHCYWLPHVWAGDRDLKSYEVHPGLGTHRNDVFATANFFNFVPWTTAIEYLLSIGLLTVEQHSVQLVNRFLDLLDEEQFAVSSPVTALGRSAIIVIRPRSVDTPVLHQALLNAGIDVALRDGAIRVSPHIYNTRADIEHAVNVLNNCSVRGLLAN
jgi:cysteine desulfurase / selenocysteine lyase